MKKASKFWFSMLIACFACHTSLVYANVVMTGTRVIYPAEQKEKTLQFSNSKDQSYLVQIWLDQNNPQSTPETADAPFMVNPQVFRIDPSRGQMVRMVYTGDTHLPADRESIFYLNFKQIPAFEKNKLDQNMLVLLVKSRLKVFYRPKTIVGQPEDSFNTLTYLLVKDQDITWLEVNNPSGYYITPTHATVKKNAQTAKALDIAMIPPKTTARWKLDRSIDNGADLEVSLRLVNDYGASVNQRIAAQHDR